MVYINTALKELNARWYVFTHNTLQLFSVIVADDDEWCIVIGLTIDIWAILVYTLWTEKKRGSTFVIIITLENLDGFYFLLHIWKQEWMSSASNLLTYLFYMWRNHDVIVT